MSEQKRTSTINRPPLHSVTQAVNSNLQACKVSFSRTQNRNFVQLEFLRTATQQKFCIFVYRICQVQVPVCKSTQVFQLNEHTVIRS